MKAVGVLDDLVQQIVFTKKNDDAGAAGKPVDDVIESLLPLVALEIYHHRWW